MSGKRRVILCCTLSYGNGRTCLLWLHCQPIHLPRWHMDCAITASQVLCVPGIGINLSWYMVLVSLVQFLPAALACHDLATSPFVHASSQLLPNICQRYHCIS